MNFSLSSNRSVSHETIGDHSPDEKIQGQSLLMQRAVCEPVSQAMKLLAIGSDGAWALQQARTRVSEVEHARACAAKTENS